MRRSTSTVSNIIKADSLRKLLIISSAIHYHYRGRLYAYGPYTREIDIWADLFPEVVIAAPCRDEAPPNDCLPFTRPKICIQPQKETGGKTPKAKLIQLLSLPRLTWGLSRAIRGADAIHVRCPGNLGLLGVILAPLFSRFLVAKYAGQWNGYAGETWTARLQRALLRSPWWRGPVTVYGQWPNQPPHVIPFFTSMMTAEQVGQAVEVATRREAPPPLRVLFAGRLSREKRVAVLLEAVKLAVDGGLELEVAIVGDGPERDRLHKLAARLQLQGQVRFIGALPFGDALKWYEWAHCLVLPSHSEGWPKVIAEGMCYGLVCIAVGCGQVPAMLAGRGVLLQAGTPQEIAESLIRVARYPDSFHPVMQAASLWARQYSLEGLRAALADLLARQWGITLWPLSTTPSNNYSGFQLSE